MNLSTVAKQCNIYNPGFDLMLQNGSAEASAIFSRGLLNDWLGSGTKWTFRLCVIRSFEALLKAIGNPAQDPQEF